MAPAIKWNGLRPYAKVGLGVVEAVLRRSGRTLVPGQRPDGFDAAARLGAGLFPRARPIGTYVIFQASRCDFSEPGEAGRSERDLFIAGIVTLSGTTSITWCRTVDEMAAATFSLPVAHLAAILPEGDEMALREAAVFGGLVRNLVVGGTLSILAAHHAVAEFAASEITGMATRDETGTWLGINAATVGDDAAPLFALYAKRFPSPDAAIEAMELGAKG